MAVFRKQQTFIYRGYLFMMIIIVSFWRQPFGGEGYE